jgi:hypothetical protein
VEDLNKHVNDLAQQRQRLQAENNGQSVWMGLINGISGEKSNTRDVIKGQMLVPFCFLF